MPSNPFGFAVGQTASGGYVVHLPHQCERWVIVGDEDEYGHPDDDVAADEAIATMRRFIVEASDALAELRRRAARSPG